MAHYKARPHPCSHHYQASRLVASSPGDVLASPGVAAVRASEYSPNTVARGGSVPTRVRYRQCPSHALSAAKLSTLTGQRRCTSKSGANVCGHVRVENSHQFYNGDERPGGMRASHADTDANGLSGTRLWPPASAPGVRTPGHVVQIVAPLEFLSVQRMPVRFVVSHVVVSSGLLKLVLEGRDYNGASVRLPLPLPLPSQLCPNPTDRACADRAGYRASTGFDASSVNSALSTSTSNSDGGNCQSTHSDKTENGGRFSLAAVGNTTVPTTSQAESAVRRAEAYDQRSELLVGQGQAPQLQDHQLKQTHRHHENLVNHQEQITHVLYERTPPSSLGLLVKSCLSGAGLAPSSHASSQGLTAPAAAAASMTFRNQTPQTPTVHPLSSTSSSLSLSGMVHGQVAGCNGRAACEVAPEGAAKAPVLAVMARRPRAHTCSSKGEPTLQALPASTSSLGRSSQASLRPYAGHPERSGGDGDGADRVITLAGGAGVRLLSRPDHPSLSRLLAGFMPTRLVRRSGTLYMSPLKRQQQHRTQGATEVDHTAGVSPAAQEGRGGKARKEGGAEKRREISSPLLRLLRTATPWQEVSSRGSSLTATVGLPRSGSANQPASTIARRTHKSVGQEGLWSHTGRIRGAGAAFPGDLLQTTPTGGTADARNVPSPHSVRELGGRAEGGSRSNQRRRASAFRPTVMVSRRGSVSVLSAAAKAFKAMEDGLLAVSDAVWGKWDGALPRVRHLAGDAQLHKSQEHISGLRRMADVELQSEPARDAGTGPDSTGASSPRGPVPDVLLQILRASNPRGAIRVVFAPGRQPAPMIRDPTVTTDPVSHSAVVDGARPSPAAAAGEKATATAAVPPVVGRFATERDRETWRANAVAFSATLDSAATLAASEDFPDLAATSRASLQRERTSGSVAEEFLSELETSILAAPSLERLCDILDEYMDRLEPRAIILACRMLVGMILQGGLMGTGMAGPSPPPAPWTSPANGAVHCYASAMDYHYGICRRAGVSVGAPGGATGADRVQDSRMGRSVFPPVTAAAAAHQPGKEAPGVQDGKQGPSGRYPWVQNPSLASRYAPFSTVSGWRASNPGSSELGQELLAKARRRVGRLARRAAAMVGDEDLGGGEYAGLHRPTGASGMKPPELPVSDRLARTEMSLAVLWAYGHLADPEDRLDLDLESDVGVQIFTAVGRSNGGSRTSAVWRRNGKRGRQRGRAAGPAASDVAVDTPVAAAGATRLPFRSVMSRLWRVALSELLLPLEHEVLCYRDPSQPSNRTTASRSSPQLQLWTMRALWAADRGAPSLLPGILLALAPRFPERPPGGRKSRSQHRTQQPSSVASGSEQAGARVAEGRVGDIAWVIDAADDGGGGGGDGGGGGGGGDSSIWPRLDALSVGQLVSVLWACGRYAGWLENRLSRVRRRQDGAAGIGVLERRRRAFAAKLHGPNGGHASKGGGGGGGRGGDMARAAAQLVACVAAAALRLLVTRIAVSPELLQQQNAAPHQQRTRKHPLGQLLQQQDWGKPSVMAAVTVAAAVSPGAPLTRQDLLAALEGATMVLGGTLHQDQAVSLVKALSGHPAMRLQDVTATLQLLRCWRSSETRTSGHSHAQPQEMLRLQASTSASPSVHSHKCGEGDAASGYAAAATQSSTLELPAMSPSSGVRRPTSAAGSATWAGVVMAGQSSERKVEASAEGGLLALETAVLRLLGGMSEDQALEMLRVQSLSSRGLRPRRGWYRADLRLPPTVAELYPRGTAQDPRQTRHPCQRLQHQQAVLQHGLCCKTERPGGSRDVSGQDPSALHEAESLVLGPAQQRKWTGSAQRRQTGRIRKLERPLPLRLRLLYRLGAREEGVGMEIQGQGQVLSAWDVQSVGCTSPCSSACTPGSVGGTQEHEDDDSGLAGPPAAGRASEGKGFNQPLRSLELQLLYQRRLYDSKDVRRYGTLDLLDLLAALGDSAKAGLPPRAATVRCVLNSLALRWLRSGVGQRDVRVLIAALFRLGWRPRTVVTVFTTAWRPFVVLEPGSVSDAAVAGMAQVLGCLTSHDFAYHPGGRDASAAGGGLAWPKLRRFWVNLLALAAARLKMAGLQLPNGTVTQLPESPGDGSTVSANPVRVVPRRQSERGLALSYVAAGDDGDDLVRNVSAAVDAVDDRQGALLSMPRSLSPYPALSVRSLVRLVWSSGRQGARVPELLGTACRLLLPLLPQLLPGTVGALAWGLGQPKFCLPLMNMALLRLLRRWMAAAREDSWRQGDAGGCGGTWTAACRVATALLQLRHISPSAPELADLLHHIARRLRDHQRQLDHHHHHHHYRRYHHSHREHQGRRQRPSCSAYQDHTLGGRHKMRVPYTFTRRRSEHDSEGIAAGPQRLLRSDLGVGCRGRNAGAGIAASLQIHNEVVNPRALASLLWALHSEVGPVRSRGAAASAATRSARRRARLLASRRFATAGGHVPFARLAGSLRFDMASAGAADTCLGSMRQDPTLLEQYPELFHSAAVFLAQRVSHLPPAALLQLLQVMAFSRPPGCLVCPALLNAFDRLMEVRPRWLLRSEGQARMVLECYRRMHWWPVGQVEEIGRRLEELNQATWRHK